MNEILRIIGFVWPYLRRYKLRLLAGVLSGLLFAASNGAVVVVVKVLFTRITPVEKQIFSSPAPLPPSHEVSAGSGPILPPLADYRQRLTDSGHQIGHEILALLDPWLPKLGRQLDVRQVVGVLLIFALTAGIRSLFSYLSAYCMTWVSVHFISDLRTELLQKLYTLSLDFFQRSTVGDLSSRLVSDTQYLYNSISVVFADLVVQPATIIAILITSLTINWHLTVFALLILPLSFAPIIIIGKKVRKAVSKSFSAGVAQSNLMIESLSGIRVVKAYHLEKETARRFREHSEQIVHHNIKKAQAEGLINPFLETTSSSAFALLILYVVSAHVTIDAMVSVALGVILFFAPIRRLGQLHVVLQTAVVSADRLAAILGEQPTVKDPVHARPSPTFRSEIRIDQLGFKYGSTPVLQDIQLSIPKGHSIGIAGESGSGKSTLVNLLLRFYDPSSGNILLDGVDIREFKQSDLLSLVAMVSQEIVIFDTTIAENIGWGRLDATQEEIVAAAKQAQAHEFIERLPEGYQTRTGERGVTLSGGQRQRLAIARAFVRNAPILILDEATASLDSQSEAEVQSAIDRLAENRTVITIAHRLSTLAQCDQIIVLEKGKIIEQGSYGNLLRPGSVFSAMARRQGIHAA